MKRKDNKNNNIGLITIMFTFKIWTLFENNLIAKSKNNDFYALKRC